MFLYYIYKYEEYTILLLYILVYSSILLPILIMNKNWKRGFDNGVVYALARIVELYDEPTIAKKIFLQSGSINVKTCAEYDVAFLRKEIKNLPKGKD